MRARIGEEHVLRPIGGVLVFSHRSEDGQVRPVILGRPQPLCSQGGHGLESLIGEVGHKAGIIITRSHRDNRRRLLGMRCGKGERDSGTAAQAHEVGFGDAGMFEQIDEIRHLDVAAVVRRGLLRPAVPSQVIRQDPVRAPERELLALPHRSVQSVPVQENDRGGRGAHAIVIVGNLDSVAYCLRHRNCLQRDVDHPNPSARLLLKPSRAGGRVGLEEMCIQRFTLIRKAPGGRRRAAAASESVEKGLVS